MNYQEQPLKRRTLLRRRSAFLGSAAAIAIAALIAGAGTYQHVPLASMSSAAYAAEAGQQQAPGFADLVAKVKPAVISVRVKMEDSTKTASLNEQEGHNTRQFAPGSPMERFFRDFGFNDTPNRPGNGNPQPRRVITGMGSGFFISGDGYAVTNYHVVDHATSVQVTTDDGTLYDAKVVGTDPQSDLALIKVDGKQDFAHVQFADHAPRIGDWVVAVGNPFGLGGTVTAGIVSASGRDIGSGPYDYIQIDAPINKGNSGGPAFDINGNVIGVNTAIFSPSGGSVGIGFDIPAETAKMVVAQLKDQGHVTRGWMGVSIQSITPDIAESLGMKEARGAIIDAPQPGSPAAKAGLQAGDVITALDGTPVKDSRDVARKVGMMAPGSSVKFDILRDAKSTAITLTLGEMQSQQRASNGQEQSNPNAGLPHLGLSLAPAAQTAGAGDKGLVVTGVEPDGLAAEHGVATGDVILDVGGKAVASVSDVRKALTDAKAQGRHNVLMHVRTADASRFVALPLG